MQSVQQVSFLMVMVTKRTKLFYHCLIHFFGGMGGMEMKVQKFRGKGRKLTLLIFFAPPTKSMYAGEIFFLLKDGGMIEMHELILCYFVQEAFSTWSLVRTAVYCLQPVNARIL